MPDSVSTTPEWVVAAGPVPYLKAVEDMQARIAEIRAGTAVERVWLLEHPPLYTAGSSARPGDLMNQGGFDIFEAGRGGQWTYHGPGQLVAYIMLDLTRPHGRVPARDTHAYVAALEAWLILTLARFGVRGERRKGRVGVWVADDSAGSESKVAAIGVRITRWVSWHGVSLNVCPDLAHYGGIVPCGITEHGITSLRALGVEADIAAVAQAMRACWPMVLA
jgi:lipoyl(octanoyl) transferase